GRGRLDGFTSSSRAAQWRPKGDVMRAMALAHRKAQAGAKPRVAWRRAIEEGQVACAAAGVFGGVGAGRFGAGCNVGTWLVANERARLSLSTTGAILLFLTIPLLIIGGFRMDWLEKDSPKRNPKVARYEDDDEEL